MHVLASSIATAGYHVLLPDLFYRMAPYDAPDPAALFSNPEVRAAWFAKAQTTTVAAILRDVAHYLSALRGTGDRIGATGYCLGGRLALCAASTYPDEFAAVAAYHPGGLVTDATDSPHRLFDKITAAVYIGAATDDPSFSAADQQVVRGTLASVEHVLEVYLAKHGWVPIDTPVHDASAADRHRETLLDLLGRTLS